MENFFLIPEKLDFAFCRPLLYITLLSLSITTIFIIVSKNLLYSVINLSAFSILISLSYILMDAPDVALTETALGAALSTCVLLTAIKNNISENVPTTKHRNIYAIILCVLFASSLLFLVDEMPEFGSSSSPVQSHITKYYLENADKQVGIPSYVAAILGSYRGFDTLGETLVVLIAGISCLFIVSTESPKFTLPDSSNNNYISKSPITSIFFKLIIPYIILYSIFIQLNGEISPGGGFQAGAIFASAMVALSMLEDNNFIKIFTMRRLLVTATAGVSIYFTTGLLCMLLGANYLEYNALLDNNLNAQHLGIFIIEIGVGITVAAVMLKIYLLLYYQSIKLISDSKEA